MSDVDAGRSRRGIAALIAITLALGCGGRSGAEAGTATSNGNSDTAGVASEARQAPPAARGRILFVGTSLTAGQGLDPEEAFPARVAEKVDSAGLPYDVVNAGVSGETSAGALRRIDWLLREPVDVLVLETGANDGLRGLDVGQVRRNIQTIIDRVRAAHPDARVLLVQMEAPPNLGDRYTSEFRAMFPELARANGVTLVPFLLEGVAGVAGLNQPDGIHPTEEGARILAGTVWRTLRPVLEGP